MNNDIDIVVTWVNDHDITWVNKYNKYKQAEIEAGIQPASSSAAFGNARYRDWGIFKYWFRGVEQNCPWVHKVFLIVDSITQLPSWINTKCEKLRVVTHDEFIPKELLPTFNGPMI